MTFPLIDWTRNGTTTPSKYRFVLSFVLHSEIGNLELKNAPTEWKEIQLLMKRDPDMHGVHIEAIVNTLTFIKEGKNLLAELWASKGVYSICDLFIYYLDHTTRTYVSMPTSYKLDFNTYDLVPLSRSTNGVRINAMRNDLVSKFQQRKNTVVGLNKLVNIGGGTITDYAALERKLSIPAINIYKSASFAGSGSLNGGATGIFYLYPNLSQIYSEIPESLSQTGDVGSVLDYTNGLLYNVPAEITAIVKGTIYFYVTSLSGTVTSITVRLSVVNSSNVETDGHTLENLTSDYPGQHAITVDESIVVPIGQTLSVIVTVTPAVGFTYSFAFNSSELTVQELYLASTEIKAESWPIYEAIERNLQIILDQQFPFYSDFFGRADCEVDWTPYAAESQLRFLNILTGYNIRGGVLSSCTVPMKFMDLFKTLRCMYAIGGGFETVEGQLRFRIEEISHFYQEVEALDLSARINEVEIEREQNSGAMFAKMKSGYSKFDYEAIMGRSEYNTSNDRTTTVPNDNEFNNISPLRADTRGVLEMRLKPIETTGTEDVTGDEDIFVVKSQKGKDWWYAETNENVVVEDGTSLFQDGSLNLYLTPVRNLIRNGQEINAGLSYSPGEKLAYQTSSKYRGLKTTGEGYTIRESDDIEAVNLPAPLWYPEFLIVTLPFYEADYVLLSANPLGYITLSPTLSGWVEDARWTFAQNKITLKLKRRIIPLPS